MTHYSFDYIGCALAQRFPSNERKRNGGKRILMPLEYKQNKKENEMARMPWRGNNSLLDALYRSFDTDNLNEMGDKPKKQGVALSVLWDTVSEIIRSVNKLIKKSNDDIRELGESISELAYSDDVLALSEKVDAIARHLGLEFQHKSEIELNEYELIKPAKKEKE